MSFKNKHLLPCKEKKMLYLSGPAIVDTLSLLAPGEGPDWETELLNQVRSLESHATTKTLQRQSNKEEAASMQNYEAPLSERSNKDGEEATNMQNCEVLLKGQEEVITEMTLDVVESSSSFYSLPFDNDVTWSQLLFEPVFDINEILESTDFYGTWSNLLHSTPVTNETVANTVIETPTMKTLESTNFYETWSNLHQSTSFTNDTFSKTVTEAPTVKNYMFSNHLEGQDNNILKWIIDSTIESNAEFQGMSTMDLQHSVLLEPTIKTKNNAEDSAHKETITDHVKMDPSQHGFKSKRGRPFKATTSVIHLNLSPRRRKISTKFSLTSDQNGDKNGESKKQEKEDNTNQEKNLTGRRRDRNNEASRVCRIRRKLKFILLQEEEKELTVLNEQLREKVEDMEASVEEWKTKIFGKSIVKSNTEIGLTNIDEVLAEVADCDIYEILADAANPDMEEVLDDVADYSMLYGTIKSRS